MCPYKPRVFLIFYVRNIMEAKSVFWTPCLTGLVGKIFSLPKFPHYQGHSTGL